MRAFVVKGELFFDMIFQFRLSRQLEKWGKCFDWSKIILLIKQTSITFEEWNDRLFEVDFQTVDSDLSSDVDSEKFNLLTANLFLTSNRPIFN